MSQIVKILLMALAWLIFTAVTFYTCVQPRCCDDGMATTENSAITGAVDPDPAPAPVATRYVLPSTLGTAAVTTGALYPELRDRLLAESRSGEPDQEILEVVGYYYDGEAAPEGYENMGLARAASIIDELAAAGIPRDRMVPRFKKLPAGDKPASATEKFEAGGYHWASRQEEGSNATQIVELSRDEIKVRFPFNESVKNLGKENEDYLKALAERISASGERVTIVGHTDNVDTDAFNLRLGQKRADFIKDKLQSYGAPAAQITTSSKGESDPEATNKTAEGRRVNRRAVITLIRQ